MGATLYGIGVGPGDPELMTAKAIRLVQACPVLAWPAPLEGEGQARSIAAAYVTTPKIEIPIRLSFRPERDDAEAAYDQAAKNLAHHLEEGRDVAVLCEGDPLFFGSFIALLTRLGGHFPVEVVPGISSPMAAAAAAVHPLSTLEEMVAIVPATRDEAALEALLSQADSIVVLKVGRHLDKIRNVLRRLGKSENALLIAYASRGNQTIRRLEDVAEAPYFSLILTRK